MRSNILTRTMICFIVITLVSCVIEKPNWPKDVLDGLWLPKDAKIVRYSHRAAYEIDYVANVCYPSKGIIDEMVNSMKAKGWQRLTTDPVNQLSSVPLNYARKPEGEWDVGVGKNMTEVYGWEEFWEDKGKNVVQFSFTYNLGRGEKIENACNMKGISAYIAEEDFRALLKAIGDKPPKAPKP